MRKTITVKIDLDEGKSKDFTIKELTIAEIIELSQTNSLFKTDEDKPDDDAAKKSQNGEGQDTTGQEKGFIGELKEYGGEIDRVMKKICDFTLDDLTPLAPSDIRLLWESFQEVNKDFLGVLEKLQILEMFRKLLMRHLSGFSKMLAIL